MATNTVTIPTNQNPKAADYDVFSPRRGRPMLFQIADPVFQRPLYPILLAMHVNPQTFSEQMQKSKSVVMTYGGFVEWIWQDELDSLSADQTSGAFISPKTGLTAGSIDNSTRGRQGTIAWERQEDLLELFRCNGAVFNGQGQPVLRGRVMCIYDRGIFAGHFTNFSVSETDDKAFTFQLNWGFKVEQTVYRYPQPVNQVIPNQTNTSASTDYSQFINSNSESIKLGPTPVQQAPNSTRGAGFPSQIIDNTNIGINGGGDGSVA